MTDSNKHAQYDEVLSSILVNEKSILGFLSTIFNFLARRTDFYYVPEGSYENMGFPAGVAEELVVKVLRNCDPKNWKAPTGALKPTDVDNEIMCSTVAQEVEVIAEGDEEETVALSENIEQTTIKEALSPEHCKDKSVELGAKNKESKNMEKQDIPKSTADAPPIVPTQKNSETYNGAKRDKYSWSQNIMELDATIWLPPGVKSAKDLKVTINPGDLCVARRNGEIILKDSLPYKIKAIDSIWSITEGKLLMHLEKVQERWWNRLLNSEETIDLSKIDCSRPLYELPDDHIAKVREMQWNQEQKMKGLPTSDRLRQIEILRRAWNVEGSPFRGQEFDPNVLKNQ